MTRPVYSDRGKISELNKPKEKEAEPSSCEKRLKELYIYAVLHRDQKLCDSLGFITTDYIGDKNSIAVSACRLKYTVDDIRSRAGSKIDELAKKLAGCFRPKAEEVLLEYFWRNRGLVRKASANRPPSFRRV